MVPMLKPKRPVEHSMRLFPRVGANNKGQLVSYRKYIASGKNPVMGIFESHALISIDTGRYSGS